MKHVLLATICLFALLFLVDVVVGREAPSMDQLLRQMQEAMPADLLEKLKDQPAGTPKARTKKGDKNDFLSSLLDPEHLQGLLGGDQKDGSKNPLMEQFQGLLGDKDKMKEMMDKMLHPEQTAKMRDFMSKLTEKKPGDKHAENPFLDDMPLFKDMPWADPSQMDDFLTQLQNGDDTLLNTKMEEMMKQLNVSSDHLQGLTDLFGEHDEHGNGTLAKMFASVKDMLKPLTQGAAARRGGKCEYTCPDEREKPVPRPGYVATANGCGTDDFRVDPKVLRFDFKTACDAHDLAYSQCGKPKNTADMEFYKRMKEGCQKGAFADLAPAPKEDSKHHDGEGNAETIRAKVCLNYAKLVELAVIKGGCQPYLDAQAQACQCVPKTEEELAAQGLGPHDEL